MTESTDVTLVNHDDPSPPDTGPAGGGAVEQPGQQGGQASCQEVQQDPAGVRSQESGVRSQESGVRSQEFHLSQSTDSLEGWGAAVVGPEPRKTRRPSIRRMMMV